MSVHRFRETPAKPGVPDFADPADANLGFDWIAGTLAPIGIAVIAVCFKGSDAPRVLEQAGVEFPQQIGQDLVSERLGDFDSLKQGDPFYLFFYAANDTLPAALQLIQDRLARLNILALATIASADPEQKLWRQFFPGLSG